MNPTYGPPCDYRTNSEYCGLNRGHTGEHRMYRKLMLECEKCGLPINSETHSYSDLGGYECYSHSVSIKQESKGVVLIKETWRIIPENKENKGII